MHHRHPRACGDPVRRSLSVLSLAFLEYWVTRFRGWRQHVLRL